MRRFIFSISIIALLTVVMTIQPAQAKSAYKVSLTIDDSSIRIGQTVTVSGTISPKKKSSVKIYIRQGTSTSYTYVGKAKTSTSGTFSRRLMPTASGPATIKVVKAKSSSRSAGSKTIGLKVYGWVPLHKLPGRVTEAGTSSVGGWTAYLFDDAYVTPNSLLMRTTAGSYDARVRFDLKSRCTSFRGDYGLDASSHHGETAQTRWFTRPGTDTSQTAKLGPVRTLTAGSPGYADNESLLTGSARPRQLVLSVQMEHTADLFAYSADAWCNLPGAPKPTFGD